MRLSLLFIAGLLLFSLSFADSFAGCANITTSGSHELSDHAYGANHTTSAGSAACVVFNVDDIIFDCNGYNLTQNDSSIVVSTSGFYIDGSRDNITVRNCPAIMYYRRGIDAFNGGSRLNITNNTIFSNASLAGSSGIIASTATTASHYTDNVIYHSIAQGIFARGDDNLFSGNEIYHSATGIFITEGNRNNFTDNYIYNASTGIRVNILTNIDHRFERNLLDLAGNMNSHGFSIGFGTNLNITSNIVRYAGRAFSLTHSIGTAHLFNNTAYGNNVSLYLYNSNSDVFADRYYNNTYDVWAEETAGGTHITSIRNLIIDNPAGSFQNYTNLSLGDNLSGTGVGAYAINWSAGPVALPPDRISFSQKFVNISTMGGSPTIDNVTWHWTAGELTGYTESFFELWKYNGSGWTMLNDTPDTTANSLTISNHDPGSDYGILQEDKNCPVITSPGTHTQDMDYVGAPNNASAIDGFACVKIASSDVIFDCDGYSIVHDGGNPGEDNYAVVVNGTAAYPISNVTITGCALISGYSGGIYLQHLSNGSVTDSVLRNSSTNIYALYVDGLEVADNHINATLAGFAGVNSSGIALHRNDFRNRGAAFVETNHSSVVNNTFYNLDGGVGMTMAMGINLSNNRVVNATQIGFSIRNSTLVNASDNYIANALYAFAFSNTTSQGHSDYELRYTIIDNPAADLTNFTNLTISSTGWNSQFLLVSWNGWPGALPTDRVSFEGRFINITNIPSSSEMNNLTWHWTDAEVISGGYAENRLELWKHNESDGWTLLNDTPDTTANTLSITVDSLDALATYALLQNNDTNCPFITASGAYLQDKDFTGAPHNISEELPFSGLSGFACVVINVSDVTYDCDGYSVAYGPSEGLRYGILAIGYPGAPIDNVTIRNCGSVKNYSSGVYLRNLNNSLLHNVTVENAGNAFTLFQTNNNTISSCTSQNSTSRGFLVSNAHGNRFIGNFANTSGVDGFYMGIVSHNDLSDNIATGYNRGFTLEMSSDNRLTNNTAHGNQRGIHLISSQSNNMTGNTIWNNTVAGLWIEDSDGNQFVADRYYNNVNDVVFQETLGTPFGYTFANVIFDNPSGSLENYTNLSVTDTVEVGTSYRMVWSLDPGTPGLYTSFENKFLDISTGSGTPSLDLVVWHWLDTESVPPYEEEYFSLWEHNGAWTLLNASPDTTANTLSISNLNPSSVYGILQTANCPVIDASGSYLQGRHFTGAPNDPHPLPGQACVVIAASDVVFDCNGFNISYSGSEIPNLFGILANDSLTNISVLNCPSITNYTHGIYFNSNSNGSVSNATLHGNGYGVSLNGCTETLLSEITAHDNLNAGIFGYMGLDTTVRDSLLFGNADGIALDQSNDSLILDNVVHTTSFWGISLVQGNDNNVTGNTVYGSGVVGIFMNLESGTVLHDNTIHSSSIFGLAVYDSDGTSATDTRIFNNTVADLHLEAGPAPWSISIVNMTIDNPLGDMQGYTVLDIEDTLQDYAYQINWTANSSVLPANHISFAEKFVNISVFAGAPSIDSISWRWAEDELGGYTESRFRLWKHNESGWAMLNNTPDTAGNSLSLFGLASFSEFAVLQDTYTPPPSGGTSATWIRETLSITITPDCEGFVVYVEDENGDPVKDAFVETRDNTNSINLLPRYTNASGETFVPGCAISVYVTAKKSGAEGIFSGHAACGICPECIVDEDCAGTHQCVEQRCVPVPCECGQVINHQCVPYECCSNLDCPPGQICAGNECVPGCGSDSDCLDSQYCDIPTGQTVGACMDVECVCGLVAGHVCHEYECCADEDCQPGEVCIDNACVLTDVICPDTGMIGDEKVCDAIQEGEPCSGCDYVITDPAGREYSGRTDEEGRIRVPLTIRGLYNVALFKDGQVLRTTQLEALPRPVIPDEDRPGITFTEAAQALFLLLLLALLIALLAYLRRRGKKMRLKP